MTTAPGNRGRSRASRCRPGRSASPAASSGAYGSPVLEVVDWDGREVGPRTPWPTRAVAVRSDEAARPRDHSVRDGAAEGCQVALLDHDGADPVRLVDDARCDVVGV